MPCGTTWGAWYRPTDARSLEGCSGRPVVRSSVGSPVEAVGLGVADGDSEKLLDDLGIITVREGVGPVWLADGVSEGEDGPGF